MFVSRRRFILKTCGTTTPLRCVRAVLALARDVAGHACVHNVFYSRREFARPQAQLQPHDNFDSEVSTRCLVCNGRVRDGRRSCTTYSISSDIASSCVPQSFLFVILFHGVFLFVAQPHHLVSMTFTSSIQRCKDMLWNTCSYIRRWPRRSMKQSFLAKG